MFAVSVIRVSWMVSLPRDHKGKVKASFNHISPDPYPLVVRLPCHISHIFDLECIQPWLKLHST